MSVLETIQRLQFSNIQAAEAQLAVFIQDVFQLEVAAVQLRPQAVSLNSFNGFVTLQDGTQLFFKSHVEPGNVIQEYYNTDLMINAGYPIIRPVRAATEPGQQMLLYEVVQDHSVFDVAWAIEREQAASAAFDTLKIAQGAADDALWHIYQQTLHWQDEKAHGQAPIHQLFYHRLAGERLQAFYGPEKRIILPAAGEVPLGELREKHWIINGVSYQDTLNDLTTRAEQLLQPAQHGPAITGHGDAHNGNVFLRQDAERSPYLLYFDPAFAGNHDPLLDLVKPFYHNVFAMWMYFPALLEPERGATLQVQNDQLIVEYPAILPAVRKMLWNSKTERVLVPLLRELKARGWLREDWRAYFQSALACCPLLTMNLADSERFPPSIALLGLAHTMEMGGQSAGSKSHIDTWLDEVEAVL